MSRQRPGVVAFDVVETLMSLEPLRAVFADAGLAPEAVPRWFDRMLRDAVALSLAGDYRPFAAVAAGSLQVVGPNLDQATRQRVLDAFTKLPAQPDANPGMERLAAAGVSVACLSNGPRAGTEAFLDRSGLDRFVDEVISVEEVGRWKPAPEVYRHALHRVGRAAPEVALVAVHAFDCHGAGKVGLTTGWASRLEGRYAEVFTPADVVGTDLVAVVDALLDLPSP